MRWSAAEPLPRTWKLHKFANPGRDPNPCFLIHLRSIVQLRVRQRDGHVNAVRFPQGAEHPTAAKPRGELLIRPASGFSLPDSHLYRCSSALDPQPEPLDGFRFVIQST